MKPILTVFTPTFNRADLIHKCYNSLKSQTNKKFKWLVIDDGSTDNTKELIMRWKEEADFCIEYIYKNNGGMHSAHNKAYENIDTELNICIDSDDYMTEDAVGKIIKAWKEKKSDHIAGLAGLDIYTDGNVIGTRFPENLNEATLFDIYHKYGVVGDKKLVYRSELTKNFPYPEYEGEKYVGLDYKCHKLDENYKLALINEPLCVVEYLPEGSSKNMLKQYRRNPRGWCFYRIENMKIPNTSLGYKFKECIHFVSSNLILKNNIIVKNSPYKFLTVCAFPLGILLYTYVMYSTRNIYEGQA